MRIEDAQQLWQPETLYLNTASYGLPPKPAWDALHWRGGRTSWEGWGDATESARRSFGRLVGVPADWVAVGANTSSMVGLMAASLPDGARVVSAEPEFTSLLWPFLAQGRDIEVECVPVADVAGAVDERTAVVAVSVVQSSTGELIDMESVIDAAAAHDARVVVDATQACGWLPIDATRIDLLACSAYKWLCSPRGTAFMSIRPELLDRLTPVAAGWYAGEDPHSSYYGPPLRLAETARRFDLVPLDRHRPRSRAAPGGRHRDDPRAQPPAGQPRSRRPGPSSGRLGDRLSRAARRRGAPARHARDGGRPRRPAPNLLARLQHGRRRGRATRAAHAVGSARPSPAGATRAPPTEPPRRAPGRAQGC